jgi:hypothetical protein
MITYGYAKQYYYTNDGTLNIQVRIPSVHGPYSQKEYKGSTVRNYTLDKDLPYYTSLLLDRLPNEGDVVALISTNSSNTEFLVIGLTGGSYANSTNI